MSLYVAIQCSSISSHSFTMHIPLQCILQILHIAHFVLFNLLIISFLHVKAEADKQVLIILMFSHFSFISRSFFLLFSLQKPLNPQCDLPHGFPLQQCVALVITSCLKQTDGIRESDGQFSQSLLSPYLCTLLLFCACVICMHASFLLFVSSFFMSLLLSPTSCEFVHNWCVCEKQKKKKEELPDKMC